MPPANVCERAWRDESRVQNVIFSRGQLIEPTNLKQAACILSRARHTRNRPNLPLSLASIERPTRPRKNTGARRIFWPALGRRYVEKTRSRAMTIFYRGGQSAVCDAPGRYGFRHIIRDFFRVPGEIDGICWRVFGGTSERISVDLDRAPRTRHNLWMTGEPAGPRPLCFLEHSAAVIAHLTV